MTTNGLRHSQLRTIAQHGEVRDSRLPSGAWSTEPERRALSNRKGRSFAKLRMIALDITHAGIDGPEATVTRFLKLL